MLTLSVRTARGPTSIRIQYSSAQFLLDSSCPARPGLSSFPNVPSLVQYYMGPKSRADKGALEKEPPSKSSQETIQSSSVVLKLKRAVYKPHSLPSLQHLTRLLINRHSDCPEQLPLPKPLLRYLQDYPFKVWRAPAGPVLESTWSGPSVWVNHRRSSWRRPGRLKRWRRGLQRLCLLLTGACFQTLVATEYQRDPGATSSPQYCNPALGGSPPPAGSWMYILFL